MGKGYRKKDLREIDYERGKRLGVDGSKIRDPPTEKPPVVPLPVKRSKDWKKVHEQAAKRGAPTHGPLTRIHIEETKEGIETRIRSLANRLRNTPYRKWTPEDLEEAKKHLGPKIITAIIQLQEKAKRRR